MKVIGITSGVGSLQYGFLRAGFEIEHQHEWRKYYNSGTFEKNYGKEYTESYEVDSRFKGVDVVVSHPECGNYSNLYCGKNKDSRQKDPGDIFKFMDLCKQYKPKFFLADNLPKSLLAVSPEEWVDFFPEYDIHFEMVSNWGYGNVQKFRNRLFVIGSLKELEFKFVPGEYKHDLVLADVIWDIPADAPNHNKMQLTDLTQWSSYQIGGDKGSEKLTLAEMQDWFANHNTLRRNMAYYNKNGELKHKPGYSIVDPDHNAPVLSGGGGFFDNHWIFDGYYRPLTMRERLRIQGFGDDFVLHPLEFKYGSKDHRDQIKQSGKCMPVNFPEYFALQVKEFLNNGTLPESGTKVIKQLNLDDYVRYSDLL
jgi:site-specific DNA-cytosine methylase